MSVPMVVEPDPGDRRFQAAATIARLAAQTDEVVPLAPVGATSMPAPRGFLADTPFKVEECFYQIDPPTCDQAGVITELCRNSNGVTVVVTADRSLDRRRYVAPKTSRKWHRERHHGQAARSRSAGGIDWHVVCGPASCARHSHRNPPRCRPGPGAAAAPIRAHSTPLYPPQA